MVATHSLPWSEEGIELDYCGKFDTRLLAPLRDYLQNGVQFTVVKTKHMYVLEDPNAQQNDDNKSLASVKSMLDIMFFCCGYNSRLGPAINSRL